MKFSCTQENLTRYLGIVSRIASRAGNLPILSHVFIGASSEGITLKATNLEIGVTCLVRGNVVEDGEFTVPAKILSEYIAFLPKETVEMELKDQSLHIKCGKNSTTIKGSPSSEFPLIPAIEKGGEWGVPATTLLEGIEQVLFAISPTETRMEISGAHMILGENKIVMAGTDSYRLAEKTIPAKHVSGECGRIIVPLGALQELARICGQAQESLGEAKLMVSENQLAVALPSIEFVTRIIEGQYPDYGAIIPSAFKTEAVVRRSELSSVFKAAGLFAKSGVHDVTVEFTGSDELKISALNSQIGEYSSSLTAEVSGEPVKVSFNWKYLLDGINALRSEKIVLKIADSSSPTMMKEERGDDYLYIVMPIKE